MRISALVNPGVTSPVVARTAHQEGGRLGRGGKPLDGGRGGKPLGLPWTLRPSANTCKGDFWEGKPEGLPPPAE